MELKVITVTDFPLWSKPKVFWWIFIHWFFLNLMKKKELWPPPAHCSQRIAASNLTASLLQNKQNQFPAFRGGAWPAFLSLERCIKGWDLSKKSCLSPCVFSCHPVLIPSLLPENLLLVCSCWQLQETENIYIYCETMFPRNSCSIKSGSIAV